MNNQIIRDAVAESQKTGKPIIIVVDCEKDARKVELKLQSERKLACGYVSKSLDECRYCVNIGWYSNFPGGTQYFCKLHDFSVAARGKCNVFELRPRQY